MTYEAKTITTRPIRWGDNDRYFGPFTYAYEGGRSFGDCTVMLGSGDGDEHPGCRLRISAFRRTLIVALPQWLLRPHAEKVKARYWDAATIARMGRDWYLDYSEREYGFYVFDGHFVIHHGRQTHDSSTTKSWGKFLPWTQWRFVRKSYYGLEGEHVFTEPPGLRFIDPAYEEVQARKDATPTRTLAFLDFDGESLTATTRIEEWEWRFGEGWFKWLSVFRRPKVRRSLDIRFSGETGKRKGSWKGGTIGHGIDMQPGELHETAFRRYCAEHEMTFVGPAEEASA